MYELRILPPAAKYLKKIKDKNLKKLYKDALDAICNDPSIGAEKTGDLSGVRGYDIFYNKTNYELAYTIKEENGKLIIIIMAGTRENFYEQLKRYWVCICIKQYIVVFRKNFSETCSQSDNPGTILSITKTKEKISILGVFFFYAKFSDSERIL